MAEKRVGENCRLCNVSFKVQFGNLGKQSHAASESTFRPSKRNEYLVVVFAEICVQVELPIVQDTKYSDHVAEKF